MCVSLETLPSLKAARAKTAKTTNSFAIFRWTCWDWIDRWYQLHTFLESYIDVSFFLANTLWVKKHFLELQSCPSDRYQSSIYTVCYDAAHNFSNPSLTPKPQTKSKLLLLLHGGGGDVSFEHLWWVLESSAGVVPNAIHKSFEPLIADRRSLITGKPGFLAVWLSAFLPFWLSGQLAFGPEQLCECSCCTSLGPIVTGSWLKRREKCGTYAITLLYAKWWRLSTSNCGEVRSEAAVLVDCKCAKFGVPGKWHLCTGRNGGFQNVCGVSRLATNSRDQPSPFWAGCRMCVRPNDPLGRAQTAKHTHTHLPKMHF